MNNKIEYIKKGRHFFRDKKKGKNKKKKIIVKQFSQMERWVIDECNTNCAAHEMTPSFWQTLAFGPSDWIQFNLDPIRFNSTQLNSNAGWQWMIVLHSRSLSNGSLDNSNSVQNDRVGLTNRLKRTESINWLRKITKITLLLLVAIPLYYGSSAVAAIWFHVSECMWVCVQMCLCVL